MYSLDIRLQVISPAPPRPSDRRAQLRRLAAVQCGHFSAAQALAIGYSYPQQTYHMQQGNWQRVARGIYRFPEVPVSEYDDLVRWSLWSRGLSVVSHHTAVAVHGLADVAPPYVHLTVPRTFRAKATGVVLHRGDLPDIDVWEREGYRITTPFRTAVDAASSDLSLEHLIDVVRSVCELSPDIPPQTFQREADRRGHREALRMDRALRGAGHQA